MGHLIYQVPRVPPDKRCVPRLIPWGWFFNRRPRGRRG